MSERVEEGGEAIGCPLGRQQQEEKTGEWEKEKKRECEVIK